jgi:hypothetical protein
MMPPKSSIVIIACFLPEVGKCCWLLGELNARRLADSETNR